MKRRKVVLADGMPLTVRRFDGTWISATRGDMSYELDRQNGNLTYVSRYDEGSATNKLRNIAAGRGYRSALRSACSWSGPRSTSRLQGLASVLRNHAVLSPSASCHDTSAACRRLVLADGEVVGRIMKTAAKPADTSWLWTLAYGFRASVAH